MPAFILHSATFALSLPLPHVIIRFNPQVWGLIYRTSASRQPQDCQARDVDDSGYEAFERP